MQLAMKQAIESKQITFIVKFKNANIPKSPPYVGNIAYTSVIKCMFFYYILLILCTVPFNIWVLNKFDNEEDKNDALMMAIGSIVGIVLIIAKAFSICWPVIEQANGLETKERRKWFFTTMFICTLLDTFVLLPCAFLDLDFRLHERPRDYLPCALLLHPRLDRLLVHFRGLQVLELGQQTE